MSDQRVRFVGSRQLHRQLPEVLRSLDDPDSRLVLTIHSKPRAVLIGAEAFVELVKRANPHDELLARQLDALLQGHEGHLLEPRGQSRIRRDDTRLNPVPVLDA